MNALTPVGVQISKDAVHCWVLNCNNNGAPLGALTLFCAAKQPYQVKIFQYQIEREYFLK